MRIVNAVKGFFIGIALVIPGLSGSIFAVVVGLYEKILDAVNNIKSNLWESLHFLLPITLGAVIGILVSTKLILWICQQYTIQSYMFFTGLVLGSIPLVIKKMRKIEFNPVYLFFTFVSFSIILYVTEMAGAGNENYIAIESLSSFNDFAAMFFAGIFSVSLMAIPGVSGSIMLMVINQYGTVYNSVGMSFDFLKFLMNGEFESAMQALNTIALLIPFMLGAFLGIIIISKILGYLIKKYESLVYYCVLGLVLSAIYILVKTGMAGSPFFNLSVRGSVSLLLICMVCTAAGFLCTVFLDTPEK